VVGLVFCSGQAPITSQKFDLLIEDVCGEVWLGWSRLAM